MMRHGFALLGATLCGCSLTTPLADLGPLDAGDAGDAGQSSDASSSDASSDAGANLISNGSFEQGAGGCGINWGAGYNATYMKTSPGRTGSSACVVCAQTGAMGSYAMDLLTPISVQPGSYYAEAWLTTPDGGVSTQAGIVVSYTVDGGVTNCSGIGQVCQGSFFTPPTGSWSPTSANFDVTTPETLMVQLHSFGAPPGSCFEVDDVALFAQ
jgi:hypothetical protein